MAVFRLGDHIRRLFASAKIFMIDVPYTVDEIIEATQPVVRVNGLDDGCYLRPLVYLGYGEMGLNPLPCPVNVSIAAWPWGTYLGDEGVANGVSVKVSSWQRHDPNAVPTAAKGTGMYVNSSLAKVEALKAGYDEAILLAPERHRERVHGRERLRRARRRHPDPADRPTPAPWTASPRTRSRPSPATSATRCATSRSSAPTSTWPTRPSSPAPRPRWCRSAPSTTGPVGAGHPGRITKEIQQTYFATVRGEVDQYKEWLDHVD